MKQKTVLITGATGLLGKQVLVRLLAQEYKVYAVKRAKSIIPLGADNIQWIEISSTQSNLFKRISEPIDFVVHVGALVSYKKSDKDKIFEVNTDWTYNLAKEALEAGVEKFIFISSISALGKNSTDSFITEETPKSENDFLTNYGRSKRKAEELLWELAKSGLPLVVLNPSVIIGPAKRYQSSAQLFAYVSDRKPFYTRGVINFVDVRDVADIILKCFEKKIYNKQYILNAGSISYYRFFKVIAAELDTKTPAIGVPRFMVILGAVAENIVSKLQGRPATLTMETAKMAGNKKIYQAQKVKNTFDFRFRSLEESIKWAVGEMKKNGEL